MGEGYGPIPNQEINCVIMIRLSSGETKTLQPGSLVKFINKTYLPRGHSFGDYDETMTVAVYSCYGLGIVPIHAINWDVY